jgi:cytochrome c553
MKRIGTALAFLALAALPAGVQGKEVETLAELIEQYDASSCRECHQEIYDQWEQSLHAKPLLGPIGRTLATFQGFVKSRDTELKKSHEVAPGMKAFLKPCVECHLPQMMDASEAVAQELAAAIVEGDE